jgi:hypothetical protein
MFSNEVGAMSHKRVLSFMGAICLYATFLITKDDHLGDLVFYMSMGLNDPTLGVIQAKVYYNKHNGSSDLVSD